MSELKLDIFGGTFDPVQPGHIELIRRALNPERALIIAPTTQNPWKTRTATPIELRLEMLRLALQAERINFVEDYPLPGKVFLCKEPYERSIEFLRFCRANFGTDIRWLVGPGDGAGTNNWYRWQEEGCPVVEMTSGYPHHSTDVREGTVSAHPAIASYIQEKGLYGEGSGEESDT